jgi:hypothetical protein
MNFAVDRNIPPEPPPKAALPASVVAALFENGEV